MTTGITKIEDLLNQDRYKWGTVKGTHPEVALANSVREDFKTIIRKQVLFFSCFIYFLLTLSLIGMSICCYFDDE